MLATEKFIKYHQILITLETIHHWLIAGPLAQHKLCESIASTVLNRPMSG